MKTFYCKFVCINYFNNTLLKIYYIIITYTEYIVECKSLHILMTKWRQVNADYNCKAFSQLGFRDSFIIPGNKNCKLVHVNRKIKKRCQFKGLHPIKNKIIYINTYIYTHIHIYPPIVCNLYVFSFKNLLQFFLLFYMLPLF